MAPKSHVACSSGSAWPITESVCHPPRKSQRLKFIVEESKPTELEEAIHPQEYL